MIQCPQCHRTYPDDAEFCNACKLELNDANVIRVFDQQGLEQEENDYNQADKHIATTLIIVLAFFPFVVYTGNIPFAETRFQQFVILGFVSVLGAIALYFHRKKAPQAPYITSAYAVLLIMLAPFGTLAGAALLYFSHFWRSES